MPAPRSIARFNKRFTNKLTLRAAGYLPGFGVVSHVGRRSGRAYRTPVNVFRTDGGYIIALTYGTESDWVKNVLAAGSCELQTRGRRVRLFDPRINTDRSKGWAPLPVRLILDLIDAPQYMRLSLQGAELQNTSGRESKPADGAWRGAVAEPGSDVKETRETGAYPPTPDVVVEADNIAADSLTPPKARAPH